MYYQRKMDCCVSVSSITFSAGRNRLGVQSESGDHNNESKMIFNVKYFTGTNKLLVGGEC